MSVRGYIQTLLNALPVGTRQPVQQAFDALYTERSGVEPGTYGSSTAIPVLTIDARGRVTAASESTFTAGSSTSAASGSVLRGTWAARPAAGSSGRMYLLTDGGYDYLYDDGSTWIPFRDGMQMVDPQLSTWAWINQGTATVSTTTAGITLASPAGAISDNIRMYMRSRPAVPYTITAAFTASYWDADYYQYGLLVRDTASSKFQLWNFMTRAFTFSANNHLFQLFGFSSFTTFSSAAPVQFAFQNRGVESVHWLRINDNGSSRHYSMSDDGHTWTQMWSEASTFFSTMNQVGVGFNQFTSARGYSMRLLHYTET